MTTLLIQRAGYCQFFKVGIEGFQRWTTLSNTTNINGPLQLNTQDKRYSYGANVSYESGDNGLEVGLYSFPYRVDLRFKGLINSQLGPSNIALLSFLYKRRVINSKRLNIGVYALGGFNLGKYKNSAISEGIGTIDINGVNIYRGHLDRYSTYDNPVVLFPSLKIELDKYILSRYIISAHASYLFKNWFSSTKPLEEGDYTYSYYQQTGSGKIADYGNGFIIGVSLKYHFNVLRKKY